MLFNSMKIASKVANFRHNRLNVGKSPYFYEVRPHEIGHPVAVNHFCRQVFIFNL